ncbi:hypothetical protein H6771_01440 [Candidatus Peribacteria bacterium]|nr:hypothetical protein [Candidatus Peribacteria bacterium]
MKKQNIILIGFHGCGKELFGKELARQLDLPYAELDTEVEYLIGWKTLPFVEAFGWQVYKELEQRVVHDFSRNFSGVVASGVTTVENSKNLDNLQKTGFFLFLKPDFEQIKQRILEKEVHYPLMRLHPMMSLEQELEIMWNQRKDIYSAIADKEVVYDLDGDITAEVAKVVEGLDTFEKPHALGSKSVVFFCDRHVQQLEELVKLQSRGRIPHLDVQAIVTTTPSEALEQHAKALNTRHLIHLSQDGTDSDSYHREILGIIREYQPDGVVLKSWSEDFSPLYLDQYGEFTYKIYPWIEPKMRDMDRDAIFYNLIDDAHKYAGVTIQRLQGMSGDSENVLQRKILIQTDHTPETLRASIERQEALGVCELLERR